MWAQRMIDLKISKHMEKENIADIRRKTKHKPEEISCETP